MTINVSNLSSLWIKQFIEDMKNGIDVRDTVSQCCYYPLYNGIWAMYENGLITDDKMKKEIKKLNRAFDEFCTFNNRMLYLISNHSKT